MTWQCSAASSLSGGLLPRRGAMEEDLISLSVSDAFSEQDRQESEVSSSASSSAGANVFHHPVLKFRSRIWHIFRKDVFYIRPPLGRTSLFSSPLLFLSFSDSSFLESLGAQKREKPFWKRPRRTRSPSGARDRRVADSRPGATASATRPGGCERSIKIKLKIKKPT